MPKIDRTISPERVPKTDKRVSLNCLLLASLHHPKRAGGLKGTYTMSSLITPLQPHPGTRRNRLFRKPNRVIPTNLHNPARRRAPLPSLNNPPVLPLRLAQLAAINLWQQVIHPLEQLEMCLPLITRRTHHHVDLNLLDGAIVPSTALELQMDTPVRRILDGEDVPSGEDAMGPDSLVGAQGALLVIHDLEEGLDELEPDDRVVGCLGICEQAGTGGGRLRVEGFDELGVEDAVNATAC